MAINGDTFTRMYLPGKRRRAYLTIPDYTGPSARDLRNDAAAQASLLDPLDELPDNTPIYPRRGTYNPVTFVYWYDKPISACWKDQTKARKQYMRHKKPGAWRSPRPDPYEFESRLSDFNLK